MTRNSTRGSRAAANEVHVLDFELDDDADCCSLTVLVKDFRFHITADANDVLGPAPDQSDDDNDNGDEQDQADPSLEAVKLGEEFRSLIAALRKEQEEAEYQGNSGEEQKDEDKEEVTADAVELEVRRHKKSEQDSTDEKDQTSTPPPDNDSGVDISSPAQTTKKQKEKEKKNSADKKTQTADAASMLSPPLSHDPSSRQQDMKSDPETQLRDFMLRPFPRIFEGLDPIPETQEGQQLHQNLQEWYSGPTYFYRLYIDHESGELKEKQLDSAAELDKKIVKMAPRISLAKDVQKLDIPWFEACDVQVLKAGEHCGLYAPTEVRIRKGEEEVRDEGEDDQVYFFKRVDPLQPAPTQREIRMLRDIEKKGLHEKMNCPVIKGLVRWYGTSKPGTSNQIMGFLQTNIEDPTPLTQMLDSDVVEDKRTRWAREAEKAVGVLHAAGLVWGDAKADNFMVDRHSKLWIIDFGGSYTEGWVDEELSETVEGDDMGVEKIVGALRDPEGMTYDPEEGIQFEGEMEEKKSGERKRSRARDDEEEDEDDDGGDGEAESQSKRLKM